MTADTWNVLHDGCLAAAEGTVPGDLTLSVDIEYLCRQLPTAADHLVVTLNGCEHFEYRAFEGLVVSDPPAVANVGLEILSAELVGDIV